MQMKTVKFVSMLAVGVALMFAATGCKTQKYTTPVNARSGAGSGANGSGLALDSNPKFEVEFGPTSSEGTGLPNWNPGDYPEDRGRFAANTVHFEYDSTVIRSGETANVQAVAAGLRENPGAKLLVEGHCDERGTDEYNRALGERRALALREELGKLGIDGSRVQTRSFGKDQPADLGNNESAWANNRRGEFVLLLSNTSLHASQ
jgi:outer membrane protein OmpA-like peptidoglycan-associated protein